jgi:hypothetical protein
MKYDFLIDTYETECVKVRNGNGLKPKRVALPRGSHCKYLRNLPVRPQSPPLLSRGSLVRVQPGAPLFADYLGNRHLPTPSGSVRSRQNPSEFTWVATWVGDSRG